MINELWLGDCLELMQKIPDKSIDMILCDLPFGTTASKWDNIIPCPPLWIQYGRVIKDNGCIALFSSGIFTLKLMISNQELFKYKWIWVKNTKGNFVNAKNRPMTQFEEILIFSKANTANGSKIKMKYNPQGITVLNSTRKKSKNQFGTMAGIRPGHKEEFNVSGTGYPTDVLFFDNNEKKLHPTQKPVALMEYLIRTYTNEGDLVLDNCCGSGTTGLAAKNTNRNFLLIEKEEKYYQIAKERLGL